MDIEQWQFDRPAYATATVAPGGANTAEVTITLRNVNGKPVGPTMFPLYLASQPTGDGIFTGAAPGAFACKTPGTLGTDINVLTAGKALLVQTLGNGTYVLSITDATKRAFPVAVQIGEAPQVVTTLSAANYG
jgi:hypothetical protein